MTAEFKVSNQVMVEQIAEYLQSSIVTGELQPGAHLVEASIAERLGVSKTPVREAIRVLAGYGLVNIQPYRGATVLDMTDAFITEVVAVREQLESFAVRLAHPRLTAADLDFLERTAHDMERSAQAGDLYRVLKLDGAFHRLFYERSGNKLLLETWDWLLPRIQLVQAFGRLSASPLAPGHVLRSHETLITALRDDSVDIIVAAVVKHIEIAPELIARRRAHTTAAHEGS